MRGIILAGGSGTRLYPITKAISKQLMPIYDKPMIYYPLSLLMIAGIREILVITTPEDQAGFQRLLGDGSDIGITSAMPSSRVPRALPRPSSSGRTSSATIRALVLGDNIFYGTGLGESLRPTPSPRGGHVFAYHVANPSDYGVVEFDEGGRVISIEEKPAKPQEFLRRPGPLLLRQPGRRHRSEDPAQRARRAGDHCGQRRVPARGKLTVRCSSAALPGWTPARTPR